MLPLMIFHCIVIGLLLVLGILFFCGKGSFLIAGYNTLPKEEKSCLDQKSLCKFMGKLMFLLAGCWLIITLGSFFGMIPLLMIGLILFIAAIVAAAVYANTGNRFQK